MVKKKIKTSKYSILINFTHTHTQTSTPPTQMKNVNNEKRKHQIQITHKCTYYINYLKEHSPNIRIRLFTTMVASGGNNQ